MNVAGAATFQSTVGATGAVTGSNLSGTNTGDQSSASQAEMETAASTTVYSSPGVQQFHPSAIKAAVRFNAAGTIAYNYNITSITDTGSGDWTVVIATNFSGDANYAGVAIVGRDVTPTPLYTCIGEASTAGTFRITSSNTAGTLTDPVTPNEIHAIFTGDQ